MALCVDLQSLPRCLTGYTVLIQVVKSFKFHYEQYPDEKVVIVVDDKGFRMPLTIRSAKWSSLVTLLRKGVGTIYLGVNYKPMKQRFTTSDFHLFLNPGSVVKPFKGRKTSKLYNFKDIPNVKNIFNHIYVVDVISVITEVYSTTYCEAAVRPYEQIPEEMSIFFVFTNFEVINCVVKNNLHDKFLKACLTTVPHYATICVLHLWDIKSFEGGVALFANNKYSIIAFEPEIREIEDARNILHFFDQFVYWYDDYANHPDRPSRGPDLMMYIRD